MLFYPLFVPKIPTWKKLWLLEHTQPCMMGKMEDFLYPLNLQKFLWIFNLFFTNLRQNLKWKVDQRNREKNSYKLEPTLQANANWQQRDTELSLRDINTDSFVKAFCKPFIIFSFVYFILF